MGNSPSITYTVLNNPLHKEAHVCKEDRDASVLMARKYFVTSFLSLFCILVLHAVLPSAVQAASGDIVTIAGGGSGGLGDDGLATSATLSSPVGVSVDTSGNIYIADTFNNRIRKVDAATGIITTVAGNGAAAYSGDSGPATSASLNLPAGVSVDNSGNIYIADTYNNRIRKVNTLGTISTLAGNGTSTFAGDGGPATSASLNLPTGVFADASGNIYIADYANNRIRMVAIGGVITTVAGDGTGRFAGDGGPAISASLTAPNGVSAASGNIYIADKGNNRIRMVNAGGTISTLVGNGTPTFAGDGGPATSASLILPYGVSVDGAGNIYIADTGNNRIRKVNAVTGIITTLAGNGTGTFAGDGGPATSASLNLPSGVSLDASGNIYIADYANNRMRMVLVLAPGIGVTDSVAPISDHQIPFGNVTQGNTSDQTVTVANSGNADLIIGNIASANPLATPFNITTDNCSGKTIAPASTCTLTVRFAPTAVGTFNDSFDIPSNDSITPTVTLSVRGTGFQSATNNPPSAPTLVFPANGQTGLGTTVSFRWEKSTDPDGDTVTYHLYTCTNQTFTGCTPVDVASSGASQIYFAGLGMYGGLMMIGMVFAGNRKVRKGLLLLTLIVLLTTGLTLASCGGGGGGGSTSTPPDANEISYGVSNLSSGTVYWKVVADDSKGGTTESLVWSFSTQ